MTKLPKDNCSQEIGRLAGRALGVKLPTSWIEKELDGDSDFGIDFLIQLKSSDNFVSFSFYLQLKGTTTPSYSADKKYISYDFKVSTLKYYHQMEPLVMVAVVDLSENIERLSECPIYYFWLEERWFSDNKEKLGSQGHISIKIPTSQLLNTNLDIYEFYSKRISEKFAVAELKKGIESYNKSVTEGISTIARAIVAKPVLLKSIEDIGDAPWLDNPNGTAANELKRCSESLSANKITLAKRILEGLGSSKGSFTKNELAEFYFQWAGLYNLEGRQDLALENYRLANNADQKDRYHLGYLESKLKNKDSPDYQDLEEILSELSNNSYHKCILKAKCLALLGRPEEALFLLQEKYPEKIIGRMIVYTISGMVDELDDIITQNHERHFDTERDTFLFNSISARRYFFKAAQEENLHEENLPIHGKASYDLELMQQAFSFARKSWEAAKELGYPGDILVLLDISILIYGYFDAIADLSAHIENILAERPAHPDLIRPYSRVLFNQMEYQRVIELMKKLEVINADDCGLVILSNYHLGKTTKVLGLVKDYEKLLLDSPSNYAGVIFCVAAEIANELFDRQLADKYERIVKGMPDGEALLAINHFITSCNCDQGNKDKYIQDLYDGYIALGKPFLIAEQLIRYLDSTKLQSAEKVIELGEEILKARELSKPDSLSLAQAFMTTGRWVDAQALAEKHINKGVETSRWELILAASFQHQGKVGAAYKAIKSAVTNAESTKEQQLFYINFCLSLGVLEDVIEIVKELLSSSSKRKEKIHFLRVLISIYSSREDYADELKLAIDRFGELADQNDCEEEGSYLLYFLTSPKHEEDEGRIKEFQSRLSTYTKSFPESPILRQGFVNPDEGAESILKSMRELAGISEDQLQKWENNKKAIRNGSLPVPFSMVHNFLGDTNNIFTTWVYSLSYPDEHIEYRIKHAPQLPKDQFSFAVFKSDIIVLEITSLLALSELGLLDIFLDNVPKFALPNDVFEHINQSAHPLGGTPFNLVPQKILNSMQKHLDKLELLPAGSGNAVSQYTEALAGRSHLLISDDLYLIKYIQLHDEDVLSGNVFNVIEWLADLGSLNIDQLCQKTKEVCDLGFFEPSMRLDFLHIMFEYYLDRTHGVEYSDTGFFSIFKKLFEVNRDSEFCFGLLFEMLRKASSVKEIHSRTLVSIFKGFLIRHPIKDLSSLIALWYIYVSMRQPPNISPLLGRSEAHWRLWGEYKEAMIRAGYHDVNFEALAQNVVRELFNVNEKTRNQAYSLIKACFTPMTKEAEDFERVYSEFSYALGVLNIE